MCCLWIRSTKQSRYKLTRAQRLCCLCVVTSVEIIAPFSAGPCPALFAVAVETGQCAGGRAGFGPSSLGLKRRRRFGTGWTAFSSRAFQNLPGASLKQKEAEEEETFSIMLQQPVSSIPSSSNLLSEGCQIILCSSHL